MVFRCRVSANLRALRLVAENILLSLSKEGVATPWAGKNAGHNEIKIRFITFWSIQCEVQANTVPLAVTSPD